MWNSRFMTHLTPQRPTREQAPPESPEQRSEVRTWRKSLAAELWATQGRTPIRGPHTIWRHINLPRKTHGYQNLLRKTRISHQKREFHIKKREFHISKTRISHLNFANFYGPADLTANFPKTLISHQNANFTSQTRISHQKHEFHISNANFTSQRCT